MGDLGSDEEHGGAVGAGCCTGSAADAGCCVHGGVRHGLGDEGGRGVGRPAGVLADEATGADDPIVGAAVDHEILDDRKGIDAVGLHGDGLAVLELAHVDLAGGPTARSLRDAVDDHAAGPADALAAVAGKGDRLLALPREAVVHDIEHLEEGALRGDLRGMNLGKFALIRGGLLFPESEMKIHGAHDRKSCGDIGGYL